MDAALPRRYGPVKHAIARSGRSRHEDAPLFVRYSALPFVRPAE